MTNSAVATPVTTAATTIWNIDPAHSAAEFKVKHMMISNVKGSFSGLSGVLTEHSADSTLSYVEASVPVATISTGDTQRDGHLRSADFFDADKYPALNFKSTKVVRKGEGEYDVTGDLTIHGVTKPVTFAVEGPSAPARIPGEIPASAFPPLPGSTARTSGWFGTRLSKPEASWWAKRCRSPWKCSSSRHRVR
jgi:polyisoprenoid-binding protein YceI